ncbi:MAG: 2-oxoglutarate ferredoxin oxidoreductase subunit alpha, partial [Candidatus Frackibacter sp. T328-2]
AAIGASLTGKKALTATSGPGFSLKQENLGFAIMGEVPIVVVDVQRVGPSTGLPTSPSQGDVMQAKWGTHGDHAIIALAPSSVQESLELTVKAFNLAEKYRTPVILLLDEIVGHMREKVRIPAVEEIETKDRKKPSVAPQDYEPFAADEDLVPPMASFGEGYRYHVTGLFHDETGFPHGKAEDADRLGRRLHQKIEGNRDEIVDYESWELEDAEIAVVAYSSVTRSALTAVKAAREEGIKVGLLQLKTIWPFAQEEIKELVNQVDKIIVPELNLGQLIGEVERLSNLEEQVVGINRIDGELIKPATIIEVIKEGSESNGDFR